MNSIGRIEQEARFGFGLLNCTKSPECECVRDFYLFPQAKGTDNYRGDDVIQQLHEDFHGKCYLCEIDELQSIQVEHLKAHHNGQDRDRMFDWNNLFYSCAHCNSVKNRKQYEDSILDCCQVEPETHLMQELVDNHVKVEALTASHAAQMTANLITSNF